MSYGTEAQYQATRPPVTPYPRQRNPLQNVATLISILLVAIGVWWLVSLITSSTTTREVSFSEPIDSLTANIENGDITVRAGDVTEVQLTRRVQRSLVGPSFDEQVSGTTLDLRAGCPWYAFGRCGVSYELVVPADLVGDVHASSGDVILEGLTGDLVVDTSSGDVVLRSTTGSVDAKASSGDIVLDDVTGDLVAHASSGDVVANGLSAGSILIKVSSGDIMIGLVDAPDRIDVQASSGDVRVTVPDDGTAYAVEGDTSSGDRKINVATDPSSTHLARLQTSSGDATLRYQE